MSDLSAVVDHNDRLMTYWRRHEILSSKKGDQIDAFYNKLIENWVGLLEAGVLDDLQSNIRVIRKLETESSEVMQLIIVSSEEMNFKLGVESEQRQTV